MSVDLRQRRAAAARALGDDPRRAQLDWQDLVAWPDWADGDADADAATREALALRCGARTQAAALNRCIDGATLQRLRDLLGADAAAALLAPTPSPAAGVEGPELPRAPALQAWLLAQGAEVMLSAVPSPALRVALRERLWPQTLPPLPALDAEQSRQTLAFVQGLET